MAARAACAPIIAELRRRVYDIGPEALDSGVQYAGDTIKLSRQFKNLASAVAVATNAIAKVWSPDGTVKVATGAAVASTATGMFYYNFQSSVGVSQGTWRVQFTGSVGSTQRRYTEEFELRKTQRMWSDDDLQRYLDMHIVEAGNPTRELLTHNPNYTVYLSEYDNFEDVTLYDGSGGSANGIGSTSYTGNLAQGRFLFSTVQSGERYLEGRAHNVYMAAADCLMELAGDPSRAYSWSRGGVTHRSADPIKLAQTYVAMGYSGGGITLNRTY